MDSTGRGHRLPDDVSKCGDNRILAWWGEPDNTDKGQPVDAGYGKTLKDFAMGRRVGLAKWLETKRNRKLWTRKRVDAQLRRRLSLRFVGRAWDLIHTMEYTTLRTHAWVSTGALLTADGSDDHLVNVQGLDGYKPGEPGTEVPVDWED